MALATSGLRFRETMAGYMSPAGSFRAGYRWGKVAGGEVRFTAAIAIPDLDAFLQDPEHPAALTARLDYDGLGWDLPVKAGRFHLFCRRNGRTRMLYYLPFTCSGQRYLLFGQKFVGDRPGLHVWRDLTSLHTQLLRLDESDQGRVSADLSAPTCRPRWGSPWRKASSPSVCPRCCASFPPSAPSAPAAPLESFRSTPAS